MSEWERRRGRQERAEVAQNVCFEVAVWGILELCINGAHEAVGVSAIC